MRTKGDKSVAKAAELKRTLYCCAAAGAMVSLSAMPAMAQDEASNDRSDVITVTGTRIAQTGMQTPVPLTSVDAELLSTMAPGALIEGVGQLPQFFGNQTPNSVTETWFERGGYGNLNMRGLGINRTLTLLNGRRMISSTAFGGVDINAFPEAMISRVETVTGGASAAYGTDAVAGVTNFILDTDFTGVQAHGQWGQTTRGDSDNYEVSLAFGTDLGDRGHFQVSGEIFEQDGVFSYEDRDWYQGWGLINDAGGVPQLVPNVVSRNSSFDGLIVAPGTSLDQTEFLSDGSGIQPFVTGSPSQFPFGIPPARHSIANGGSGDDLGAEAPSLYPDVERNNIFAYADYELANNFTVYAQYIRGQNKTSQYNYPRGSLHGTPTAITIFADNAFLPDDVRQIMMDESIDSFTLKRMGSLEDIGADMRIYDDSVLHSITGGFNWMVENGGFMDGWSVDGYYQYGRNTRKWYQIGLRVDRIHAAVDAVDDGMGNIVCRTSLFNDYFEGCEPLNLFGRGNASAAAIDWVVGYEPGQTITTPIYFADTGFDLGVTDTYTTQEAKVNITNMRQHLFELSASGEIYEGWGAGPISMAFGGSHREEKIRQIVRDPTNPPSDHDNGHPVLCDSDPEAIAAGLRGVSAPDCGNTVGLQYSKVSNINGKITVTEAFTEMLVPLVADAPMMEQLTLHGAARWADYSGSGSIWAWKGGLDWQVTGDFRLRGTYSRDVRAANLSERFDKTGGSATITDPRYPGDGVINVTRFSGGNPEVSPEKADTITVGFVYQPSYIDGFSIAMDWYQVKIDDAIGQLGVQAVADRCEEGAVDLCELVSRDTVTDRIVLIGDVFINVDQAKISGIDLETSYQRDVSLFGGDESIGWRFFGTWLDENSETLAGTNKIDRAGQVGLQQSDGIAYTLPEFKFTTNLTYEYGPFRTFLQGRYIGGGTIENSLTEGVDIGSNHVDSAFYLDLGLSYFHELDEGSGIELYGNMTNVLDQDPPITPYYSAFFGYTQQANPSLHDVLGRRFVIGARVNF
ncbi:TonB-dependent receptor plug domain-containing protein [Hyphococcus sp.]|uniref:TonB-dependent receptor plug domain-containing protein n=3 Tax=Hyphococcus sp. TaxID=2038636 RepID=UPI0035C77B88